MKHIVFTVTNDLSFDQRMQRTCKTLSEQGYHCTLIGRKRAASIPLQELNFDQKRIPCVFEKGKLFYLEYNFKLLLYLLRQRFDIICSVDLDTILPGYIASKVKNETLVYDAHEYFTEMEEIVSRPLIRKAWRGLEKWMIKRISNAYTISNGYAKLYKEAYNRDFAVVRNVPELQIPVSKASATSDKRIIQYQGALNMGRGLEEMIKAMDQLEGFELRIFGSGPMEGELKQLAQKSKASNHIQFMGSVTPNELRKTTSEAWLGLCLFSETGLHHKYSLANRFFDYVHARVPQLAMSYPEYEAFNQRHEVALLIKPLTPESIVAAIHELKNNQRLYDRLQLNCETAARENCWEEESKKLVNFYASL